jgi:hypothetical protein
MTRYVLHSMRAIVQDLPERAFTTVEDEGDIVCCSGSGPSTDQHVAGDVNGVQNLAFGGKTIGVRTHHWVWRREEEVEGRSAPD